MVKSWFGGDGGITFGVCVCVCVCVSGGRIVTGYLSLHPLKV